MGGGLMQLVAYGAQDIYLTGNPQITFFKVVYRRHTNFSMEAIGQTWDGTTTGTGRCTATISRNGDLVHRMYLECTTDGNVTVDNPGSRKIDNVVLEIGGQQIDKHTGGWMETWAQLTEPNPTGTVADADSSSTAFATSTLFQNMSAMGGTEVGGSLPTGGKFFVPLQFWFCRNPGLALPLIALQYHEVKVVLQLAAVAQFVLGDLYCDYIYLDTDERRRFAQVSHEYLIEQVQEQSWSTTSQDLNFNHPVKELVWTGVRTDNSDATAMDGTWKLKLNGHDRFATRDYRYFSRTQIWEHHSGPGGLTCSTSGAGGFNDSICVYSFALKPEEHQPSGTCNFSRIDNAQLTKPTAGSFTSGTVYAVNYNVLRIMSGMGGLAYSN
jgi:hypothetical protein